MTGPAADPFLTEVAKALPDVDVVAIALPDPDQLPPPLEGAQAEQASRTTIDDLVDAVVGVWEVIFPTVTPPAQIETQWFSHPTGDQRLVKAQVWTRHHVDDSIGDLAAGATELDKRGWRVATDYTSDSGRLRRRSGHMSVELHRRSGGLVLVRAESRYLLLGELSSQLVGGGTAERPWP